MARRLELEIVGDARSLERAFRRSASAGQTFERRMVNVSKKAALALGAAGVSAGLLGAKFVRMAGDAEEVRSKFQVTFGQEMPRMVRQLDVFAKATGASRYELRQQTADLGALLVPLIGSRKEAGNLSVGFTKLATDLSSFNNVPVEEALLAIRAGLVGEAEPLRRFSVLLNEAAVKAEAYRSGIARAGAVLTEQQKVQARANLIMQQTQLAQGDATRTADSFTNQLRKLKNQASDTATDLGMKLLPIATNVLTKLTEWGPAIRDRVQPHLDALGGWADDHKQEFKDLFEDIETGAKNAATALGGMASGADKTAKAMGGWDDAFRLVIEGILLSKLLGISKRLGGIEGTLKRIKGLGPLLAITIGVDLVISGKAEQFLRWAAKGFGELTGTPTGSKGEDWVWDGFKWVKKGKGAGIATPPGGITPTSAIQGGTAKGVQLPTSPGANPHPTTGLPGFPAIDIFATAGTPILAPEDGSIVSIRPFNSNPDFYGMAIYYLGKSGRTYYIKHIFDPSPIGKYKKGAVLGKVVAGTSGGPHVHLGVRSGPGIPIPISNAGGTTGGGGGGGTVGGGATGGGGATPVAQLIPGSMRLALAKAEGTRGVGDDLSALRAMVAYLQKILPKTGDIEKRIEITEALNGLRERIKEITQGAKKTDISEAVDMSQLKEKLRKQFAEALEAARARITAARSSFASAFSVLGDALMQVFDAKTQKMLDNLRVSVMGFTVGAGDETPAERALRERREASRTEDLQRALREAKTEEERTSALDAIAEDALEQRARLERQAADDALAEKRRELEEQRATERNGFAKALADMQARWETTKATTAQRTKELHALLAKFGIPFESVGTLLGQSFATGFLEAIDVVFQRLRELNTQLNKITPQQAAELVRLRGGSALEQRSAALNALYGLGVPSFQHGGKVPGVGPQLAIVHGGETITPRGQTGPITLQVMLDRRVIAEALFDPLRNVNQRRALSGGGGF